jgi:hypothetical protein
MNKQELKKEWDNIINNIKNYVMSVMHHNKL